MPEKRKDNKIKVLHLITGLNTGGAEVVIKDLLLKYDKEKFSMSVVSFIPLGPIGKMIRERGGFSYSLNVKFKYNPFPFFTLYKLLKNEKPDVLHTHLFHADIAGRIAGRLAKTPVIMSTFHSIDTGGTARVLLLRMTKSLSHYNIAVATIIKDTIISSNISLKDKTAVIYNGADADKYHLKREHKKKCRDILSIGRLHRQKGHSYLVDAAQIVYQKHPQIKVVVLGEGPERIQLEEHIKKNSLEDKVLLMGEVKNVVPSLQEADFFVMASISEGFPLAVIEAAASGLPIIATNVGGVSEIIKDGVNGFLVPPKDAAALAEKIDFVLGLSPQERFKIGEAARSTVEEKFSVKKMVSEYETLYKKLTESLNN